jgi:hypothetical protein
LAAALAVFIAATLRLFVWPPLVTPPDRVDAIIELAGPGIRDAAALELARQGRAPVLVQSTTEQEAGTSSCLPSVPGVTIICFHPDPPTTKGEAEYIGRLASERHWSSVIIVTTPDHALRAKLRFERCFAGQVYVSTAPLPGWDWFVQIPYQWAAGVKAMVFERAC